MRRSPGTSTMAWQHKEKILLVDDDRHLVAALGDYLRMQGYSVVTASSGERALKLLEDTEPDLIVLDIALPGMGGIAFLRLLRDDPVRWRYPVLVFTAKTYMQDFFAHVSVDGFLAKPCNESAVLARIDEIIRRHRPEHERSEWGTIKILYAEDDTRLAREVVEIFTRAGHRVRVIVRGPEVIKAALSDMPDVVVMKEILPGLNGSAVAAALKNLPTTKYVPVVLYDDTIPLPGSVHPFAAEPPRHVTRFVHSTSGKHILAAAEDAFFRARRTSAPEQTGAVAQPDS